MNRLSRQMGFSLIEVMSAIGLFSIVALGLSSSTITNMKLNTNSKTIAAANALVQNKIEQIRLLQPQLYADPDLVGLKAGKTYTDSPNPMSELGLAGGSFTRQWSVTSLPQYLNGSVVGVRPGLVEVVVTVTWSGPMAGSTSAVTYACTSPRCA